MVIAQCSRSRHVSFENKTFYANMAADIATDMLVMCIPITIIWNIQVPIRKRLLLLGIFSVTVIITVIAIIRVALVKGRNWNQLRNSSIDWLYLWSSIEMGVGTLLPGLFSLLSLNSFSFERLFELTRAFGSSYCRRLYCLLPPTLHIHEETGTQRRPWPLSHRSRPPFVP